MANLFCSVLGGSGGEGGARTTITVNYDEGIIGETITLIKGGVVKGTATATSALSTSFDVNEDGVYTVTVSNSPLTETVNVSFDYNIAFTFQWETWVEEGGLNSDDYDSLDDLLADEEAIRRLCLVHASVDYMCSFDGVNTNLETIINNDIFAKWVNLSDYSLDMMYANSSIKDVMDEADKYGYGEWALMPQVPKMTSNTAPYGTVTRSSIYNSAWESWKAFDGDESTRWIAAATTDTQYIEYEFVNAVRISSYMFKVNNLSVVQNYYGNIYFKASNDGQNYVTLDTITASGLTDATVSRTVNNDNSYIKYRIEYTKVGVNDDGFVTIQFYAWQPKGNVPVMTSNTAPYGTVTASGTRSTDYPYRVFDENTATTWQAPDGSGVNSWVQYEFVNPVCIKKMLFGTLATNGSGMQPYKGSLYGSNDGSTWGDPLASITFESTTGLPQEFEVANNNYYKFYRLQTTQPLITGGNARTVIHTLQFYGRELSVSVPVMTSNTAPYGEVSASGAAASSYPWYYAFDQNINTYCRLDNVAISEEPYIEYTFENQIVPRKCTFTLANNATYNVERTYTVQGYDGSSWDDLDSVVAYAGDGHHIELNGTKAYSKLRLAATGPNWRANAGQNPVHYLIVDCQFFGLDYSEKEFETGTTKKWLYDHGVELETLVPRVGANSDNVIIKRDSDLYLKLSGTNASTGTYCNVLCQQDLSNYSLARSKVGNEYYESGSSLAIQVFSSDAARPANGQYNDTYQVAVSMMASQIPYDLSLDVSAINQDYWVSFGGGYYANCVLTLKELWLE